MDSKKLIEIVDIALKDPENMELSSNYADALEEYLKKNKTTPELVSVVIKAMDIDRGTNYFDYIEGLSKNDIQNVWKIIKDSKEIKEGKSANAIKLLMGIFYLAIIKSGNLEIILGNVITTINGVLGAESKGIAVSIYGPIFIDYFANEIQRNFVLPKWNCIKISPEAIQKFTTQMLQGVGEDYLEYHNIKSWLNEGKHYAKGEIEKKNIEAKIPKSQILALQEIVKHYTDIEQQLRSSIYQVAYLENKVESLNGEISELSGQKVELERKIKSLQGDVFERERSLDIAGKEIEERKKLNQAQVQYREDAQEALLHEISRALKAEYGDFIETETMPMSEMLGEIYREKLKNIAKILEKKGIKVNE